MMKKDFWSSSKVAVIGGGSWASVLANVVAKNTQEVRMWMRSDEQARAINSTKSNPTYVKELKFSEKVSAGSDPQKIFDGGVQAVLWALPSSATREQARMFSKYMSGEEIVLHATKGIEPKSLKRISEILTEELPTRRIGVISGPNLAGEIAKNEPAATVVASNFSEVVQAGTDLLTTERFRIYGSTDVIGVEWAGVLKNVLAIAAGAVDALKMGWNTRALLITRGLAEMVRFGVVMGAKESTFLGLAGIGDLLATCSSPLSRNYQVGFQLVQNRNQSIEEMIGKVGGVAEGVQTTRSVWEFSKQHKIYMPITEAVYRLIHEKASVQDIIHGLMTRPSQKDSEF
jgi:glycerol-3-phosphate dehydrogenase (NAD(P)+)